MELAMSEISHDHYLLCHGSKAYKSLKYGLSAHAA